jgi:hypothetical protein
MPASLLIRLFVWLWFGAAIAVGHLQLLQKLPPFAAPALIVGLSGFLVSLYLRVAAIRDWVNALDLRALVLLHVTRFIGIYFLVLFQRGELPRAFALPAGIGDIIVATMALPVVFAPLPDAARLRAIVIWNVVGFVDLVLVVVSAARIVLSAPLELRALTHLPLSLLPTFLVPLLIATHVILFLRTRTKAGETR